jgi:hypothetical protein
MRSDDPTITRTWTLIRRKPRISGPLSSGDALLKSGLCKNFWRPTYVMGTLRIIGGSTRISIRFLNDDGPRDLYVDKIILRKVST